jgi:predicted AAA+ superfamily ATPase
MNTSFRRSHVTRLLKRLQEPRNKIQALVGPRQVGKTTIVQQAIEKLSFPALYITADEPTLHTSIWLQQNWENARLAARQNKKHGALLVIDEVQKISNWSEIIKRLWDEDTLNKIPLRVVLLGSAPLLVQTGLTESLAGRIEMIHVGHWTYLEMQAAFGMDLQQYLFFGGYPGAAHFIEDEQRWRQYIKDSLIETTVSRDVLLFNRIDKPALLRQLFHLGCIYSGQIVSYQKLVGRLQDAGNTTTLAHYLRLLGAVGMLIGGRKILRQKNPSESFEPQINHPQHCTFFRL